MALSGFRRDRLPFSCREQYGLYDRCRGDFLRHRCSNWTGEMAGQTVNTPTGNPLLAEIARCYGLEPAQLSLLTDNPADGVDGFTREEQAAVLKCTPATVRAEGRIRGQVAWMNDLVKQGAAICRVLPSPEGKLVEILEVEGRRYY